MNEAPIWFHPVELAANGGALLVHLALKATLLLLVLWGVTLSLRRASAAIRHMLWFAGCLGLLLLPVLITRLPAWQPVPLELFASPPTTAPITPIIPIHLHVTEGASSPRLRTIAARSSDFAPTISREQWILAAVFACWLAGLLVITRKLAMGFMVAKRLQQKGKRIEQGALWNEFTQCATSLTTDVSARWRVPQLVLVEDEALPIPLTWGHFHPVVLMPRSSLRWPATCVRAAFLHELSHVRRFDWLIQSLASLTCLLYWFHPLVWFASRRLRLESEHATDDRVLASGFRATEYSSSLLEIVRFVASHRERGLDQKDFLMKFAVPMSGTSKIETRLRSILNPQQSRSAVTKKLLAVIVVATFATIVPLAAARQQEEPTSPQKSAPVRVPAQVLSAIPYVREAYAVAGSPATYSRGSASSVSYPMKKTLVTGFKFNGNTTLRDEELDKVLVSRTGVFLDTQKAQSDGSAIEALYDSKGIFVRVPSIVQDPSGIITYTIVEKPVVTGFRFNFSGPQSLQATDLQKVLVSKIGASFEWKNVLGDKEAIKKAYAAKGLAVSVNNMDQDSNGTISYNIREGRVTQVKVEGLTKTDPQLVSNLMTFQVGDPADPLKIYQDTIRILDSKLFGASYILDEDDPNVKGGVIITYVFVEKGTPAPIKINRLRGSVHRVTTQIVPAPALPVQNTDPVPNSRIVTGFKFSGNTALPTDELRDVLSSKTGVLMIRQNIEDDVKAIQKAYSDKGFAALVQNTSQDDSGVVVYSLREAKVTQIKLSGIKDGDMSRANKLIETQANQLFDANAIRQDVSRLYDTGLFGDANYKVDDDPKVEGGVVVTMMFKYKNTTP